MRNSITIKFNWAMMLAIATVVLSQSACGGKSGSNATSEPEALEDGGTLVIRVAGTEAGVNHDVLQVAGRATLAGTLQMEFAADYIPSVGQRFKVLQAEGGISGTFGVVKSNVAVPMQLSQDENTVIVIVGS